MSRAAQMFSRFAADAHFAHHGEPVVYVPAGGGAERTVSGIVDRQPPERFGADGTPWTPRMTLRVQDDAAKGIAATELDAFGADRIRIRPRPGADLEEFGLYLPPPGFSPFDAGLLILDVK